MQHHVSHDKAVIDDRAAHEPENPIFCSDCISVETLWCPVGSSGVFLVPVHHI